MNIAQIKSFRWLVFAYAFLLMADQVFIIWDIQAWRYASKPLLMPVLLVYFLLCSKSVNRRVRILISAALLASWAGDVLLMLEANNSSFFMAGLASFLLAHIFYGSYFERTRKSTGVRYESWLVLPVLIYLAVLLYWLEPYLGDLRNAVFVYGIIISLMLLLALQVNHALRNQASRFMALGAFFFVLSDSLLAVNKFYASFQFAGVAVMYTYGMAQLFIVSGALLHELSLAQKSS